MISDTKMRTGIKNAIVFQLEILFVWTMVATGAECKAVITLHSSLHHKMQRITAQP
jgi:hypothetical protein